MKYRRKAATRRFSRSAKRSYSRSSSGGMKDVLMGVVVPAAAYGAIRNKVSDLIIGAVGRPLGDYTDEAALGFAGWFLMKTQKGFLKDFGRAALTVESASLGNQIGAPIVSGVFGGTASSSSSVSGYA